MILNFPIRKSYLFIYITALLFFLFSLQDNLSASHDGISYLQHIVSGENLFHPHHLLYNAVARLWLLAGSAIFPSVEAHYIVESLNAFFGSANILLVYIILYRRAQVPLKLAAICSVLVAFSFGVWSYATNVEVYSCSIFFALLLILRISAPNFSRKYIVNLALIHLFAILFHQVNVLLFPIVVYALYTFLPHELRFKRIALYTTLIVGSSILVYLAIGVFVEDKYSMNALTSWITLYVSEHNYWQAPSLSGAVLIFTGIAHSQVGGHFLFRLPWVQDYLTKKLNAHNLVDERFLAAGINNNTAELLFYGSILIGVILLTLAGFSLSRYIRTRSMTLIERILMLSLLVYSLFFFFWDPENLEFWILQSIIAWILITISLKGATKFITSLFLVLPILFFVVNYFGSMRLLQDRSKDWYHLRVHPVSKLLSPEDIVTSEQEWILADYLRYHTNARYVSSLDSQFLNNAETVILSGNKVMIFDDSLINHPAVDSLLKRYDSIVNVASGSNPSIKVIQR